jgi:hypothetical protein
MLRVSTLSVSRSGVDVPYVVAPSCLPLVDSVNVNKCVFKLLTRCSVTRFGRHFDTWATLGYSSLSQLASQVDRICCRHVKVSKVV